MFQNFQLEWVLRIICSLLAGMIIGQERQNKSKEAGVRTHTIVAMSACLLMIVSKYGFEDMEKFDAARVAAQVVSGVGFLGAGLIFIRNDFIQGLTTAAGIWATSAIGLCFGTGMYIMGFVTSALMYYIQSSFHPLFQADHMPRSSLKVRLYLQPDVSASDVFTALKSSGYTATQYRFHPHENGWIMNTEIYTYSNVKPLEFISELESYDKIDKAELL